MKIPRYRRIIITQNNPMHEVESKKESGTENYGIYQHTHTPHNPYTNKQTNNEFFQVDTDAGSIHMNKN